MGACCAGSSDKFLPYYKVCILHDNLKLISEDNNPNFYQGNSMVNISMTKVNLNLWVKNLESLNKRGTSGILSRTDTEDKAKFFKDCDLIILCIDMSKHNGLSKIDYYFFIEDILKYSNVPDVTCFIYSYN